MILESLKKDLFGASKFTKKFAIMTPENPMTFEFDEESNKKLRKQCEAILKLGKYVYRKVKGQYMSAENSYVISNITLNGAMQLAGRFAQQSFIFGNVEDGKMVYKFYALKHDFKPKKTFEFRDAKVKFYKFPIIDKTGYICVDTKNTLNYVPDDEDFFTRHHEFKFNIPFETMSDVEAGIEEEYRKIAAKHRSLDTFNLYLDDSMNEGCTEHSNWQKRIALVEGDND